MGWGSEMGGRERRGGMGDREKLTHEAETDGADLLS